MNARIVLTVLGALAVASLPQSAPSQGFAGLGSDAQGFAMPQRGRIISLPSDHGPHPDYRIEWWYVTANLMDDDGKQYGAQWTLFRSAMEPGNRNGFSDPQIWMGHAALTSESRHYVAERLARGGVGQANVTAAPFRAWIDDWEMRGTAVPGADGLANISLSAAGIDFGYTLNLETSKPVVLQGDRGYSVKSAKGQASYYYSQPFYLVSGTIKIGGADVHVSGKAWLDREWSSQPLSSDQTGWDWFSLHLEGGEKVMAFRLRDDRDGFISATWISPDGQTVPLSGDAVKLEPVRHASVNGRQVPVAWHVQIHEKSLDITTEPLNDQSWMSTTTPYWEGPIAFSGTSSGVGYLEMTGY